LLFSRESRRECLWESHSLSISKMELAKHIKPLAGESAWPIWKRKIRDVLDYHEGAVDVIDGRLVKPEPLRVGAEDNVVNVVVGL
jgi:hypothetical protein